MDIFMNWIGHIIIFLLIGTLIELILPNNSLKKYVNIVYGLLFIIVLTEPLLSFFSVDFIGKVNSIENLLVVDNETEQIFDELYKDNEQDINSAQSQYILQEIAAQLRYEANDQLKEQFQVAIEQIDIELNETTADVTKIDQLTVFLRNLDETEMIEPISIDIDKQVPTINKTESDEAIIESLITIWNLTTERLTINWL